MIGNREIPTTDQRASQSAGDLLKEGVQAALYAAIAEPAKGGAQLLACGVNSVVSRSHLEDNGKSGVFSGHWMPQIDLVAAPDTPKTGAQEWAQTVGSAVGQLLPLMAVGCVTRGVSTRVFGESETLMLRRSGSVGFNLGEAAATGFINDAVFKPSSANENIVSARLLNGVSGGVTFATMTAGSLLIEAGAAKMASRPIVAGLMRNRVLAGAVSGVPGALLGAELDSYHQTGHKAGVSELTKAATQMAVIGGLFGVKETLFGSPSGASAFSGKLDPATIGFTPKIEPHPIAVSPDPARAQTQYESSSATLPDQSKKPVLSAESTSESSGKTPSSTGKREIRVREKQGWNENLLTADKVAEAAEIAKKTIANPNADGVPISIEQAQALRLKKAALYDTFEDLEEARDFARGSPPSSWSEKRDALQTQFDEQSAELDAFVQAAGAGDVHSLYIARRLAERKYQLHIADQAVNENLLQSLRSMSEHIEQTKSSLLKRPADRAPRMKNETTGEWIESDRQLSDLELAMIVEINHHGYPLDRSAYQHLRGRGLAADTFIRLINNGDLDSGYLVPYDGHSLTQRAHEMWLMIEPFVKGLQHVRELEADPPKREMSEGDRLSDEEMQDLHWLRFYFPQEANTMQALLSRRGPVSECTASQVVADDKSAGKSQLSTIFVIQNQLSDAGISKRRMLAATALKALDLANRRVYELDELKAKRSDDISPEELAAYLALQQLKPRDYGVTAAFDETFRQRGPHSIAMLKAIDGNPGIHFDQIRKDRLEVALRLQAAVDKWCPDQREKFPENWFHFTDFNDLSKSSEIKTQREADDFVKLYATMRDERDLPVRSTSDFLTRGPNLTNTLRMTKWGNLSSLNRAELAAIDDHIQNQVHEQSDRHGLYNDSLQLFDGSKHSAHDLQMAARAWQVARTMPFELAREVGAMPLEKRVVAAAAWEDVRSGPVDLEAVSQSLSSSTPRIFVESKYRELEQPAKEVPLSCFEYPSLDNSAPAKVTDFQSTSKSFWKRFGEIEREGRKQAIARLREPNALRPAIDAIHRGSSATAEQPTHGAFSAEERDQLEEAVLAVSKFQSDSWEKRFAIVASIPTTAYRSALHSFTEMEPMFAERHSEDAAGGNRLSEDQRKTFPLRLALTFKGASGEWLAKQLEAGRTLHDALYWLPLETSPEMKGLNRYLLRHPEGKVADLELIAKSWPQVPEEHRLNSPKTVAQFLREKSFAGAQNTSLAAEAARAGVENEDYPEIEARYLASLDVPSPFPLNIVWRSGDLQGRFLPRNDPRGLFLGIYTNCCQHPDGGGDEAAWHGQQDPRGGFFVVENKAGEIIAQSWVWIADNGALVFDNVEAKGLNNRMGAAQGVYQAAADDLQKEYGLVLLGTGNSDIDLTGLPGAGDKRVATPHDYENGYTDAHGQVVLAGDTPTPTHVRPLEQLTTGESDETAESDESEDA